MENRMSRIGPFAAAAFLVCLAACGSASTSLSPGASLLLGASVVPIPSLAPSATTLTPGCFLTVAEVESATGHALSAPPEGSTGPKGDQSCSYALTGGAVAGFGCHCLSTNGPFDLQGQGTAWLKTLPGGQTVPGVGDGAYFLMQSTASDFWAVKGQIGIHISIAFQSLTVEQFTTLANAAFGRLS
jgi:hypothetical protein